MLLMNCMRNSGFLNVFYFSKHMSPTGTKEGDIHMQYDYRVSVDEYAEVIAIPFG